MTGSQKVTACRRKRKLDLMYIHGNKCAICGYDKTPRALQFHHIDESQKSFGLSDGNTRSWEDSVAESRKCILVCGNCHAEIHDGLINIPLFTSINEELLKEKNNEKGYTLTTKGKIVKPEKETIKNYCPTCGKEITWDAYYCADCWAKQQRIVDRPNREQLKKLIRTTPFTKIGEMFNVSDNAIRKWCDTEHLPRTKREINSYSDDEWEQI